MKLHIWISLYSFLAYEIHHVSSITYSCNRAAECGCSKNNAVLTKIVGGESAVESSWAWAASLQKLTAGHFCGGTIISASHILTAAHCVEDTSDIVRNVKVFVGIDKLSNIQVPTAQQRSIVRVFSHPQYNPQTHANDIAILQLDKPLSISSANGTPRVCLPYVAPTSMTGDYPFLPSTLVAIGWGVLTSGSSSIYFNQHLQQVTLATIGSDHRMCRSVIQNRRLQFCAGVVGGGKDTCQGDSGGPLMHFDDKERRWVLVGVTSYGIRCADPNYAGVYTRVSVYRDWIRSIVGSGCAEIPINGTGRVTTNSAQNVLMPYYSLTVSLFSFMCAIFFNNINKC
ncbi:unnamed protein product [Adineta ricciae]|uniref:Peptidase S1 domain-containing protein n=1 Tax=Adineta ricciae TaxID=249248 RepID=A0A813Y5U6_ADIRI|nr:unnamed protein product [Adineta ricciae]CAF0947296.1 unnamed protein product [Adineta ricciae]